MHPTCHQSEQRGPYAECCFLQDQFLNLERIKFKNGEIIKNISGFDWKNSYQFLEDQ